MATKNRKAPPSMSRENRHERFPRRHTHQNTPASAVTPRVNLPEQSDPILRKGARLSSLASCGRAPAIGRTIDYPTLSRCERGHEGFGATDSSPITRMSRCMRSD